MHESPPPLPPIRPAEARALAAAERIPAERLLCTTVGRAHAARELARQRPEAAVWCWFLDDYQRQLAAATHELANLALVCQPDLPEDRVELAVLPFSLRGEAELTREMLQQACLRLELGGTLVSSVNNPQDRWLHEQLQDLFEKVTVQRHDDATAYIARKTAEPRKVRDFRCQLAFRDGGRLIKAVTRPGVFSHRRLDAGARQLLNAVEVTPGMRILDIGCGAGTVALGLAARDPTATVHAVDSNARAIQCTLAGAELNALTNVTAELNATGSYGRDGAIDLAVANPPYYADHRIADLFLSAAHRSLKPGGRVFIVAKRPDWYELAMPGVWKDIQHWPSKLYQIITAVRP
jgi:16S rRNA (guanine1207-N2)-methyltransferase